MKQITADICRRILCIAVVLLSTAKLDARVYTVGPNVHLWSDDNYGQQVGYLETEITLTDPVESGDFFMFEWEGKTVYVNQSYCKSGDFDLSLLPLQSADGAFYWRKTINYRGKEIQFVYDDNRQLRYIFNNRGSAEKAILCKDGVPYISCVEIQGEKPSYKALIDGNPYVLPKDITKEVFRQPAGSKAEDSHGNVTLLKVPLGSEMTISYDYGNNRDAELMAVLAQYEKDGLEAVANKKSRQEAKAVGGIVYAPFVYFFAAYFLVYMLAYRWVRRQWNRIARAEVAPVRRFNTKIFKGIIPSLIILAPVYWVAINFDKSTALYWWILTPAFLGGIALSIAFVSFVIPLFDKRPRRAVIVEHVYAVFSIVTVYMLIYLLVVAAFVAIVLSMTAFGLAACIDGFIAGGSSAIGSAAGLAGDAMGGASDEDPNILLDSPTDGDDGGIIEGGFRRPLRDNRDGTMTDNMGRLYKKDGNHVRRLS